MHGSRGSWAATAGPETTLDRAATAPFSPRTDQPQSFPELDCLRGRLPTGLLAAAEARAAQLGLGADRVLIAAGDIDEETYVRALANALGATFEPLDEVTRAQCPLDDARLCESVAAGLIPIMIDGALRLVLAPRNVAARRLSQLAAQDPSWAMRFRLTTGERIERFILERTGDALIKRACNRLKQTNPLLSAATRHAPARWRAHAALTVLAIAAVLAPSATVLALELALALLFMAWLGFRLVSSFVPRPAPVPSLSMPDAQLPVYTVIAALYREAESVPGLIRALENLDYPREKLDLVLAVEADDAVTLAAIEKSRPIFPVTVLPVPVAEPRTKPKALDFALPFARGSFTVIYDAEDRPEPGQLRRAFQAFMNNGDELACVQARLCIDNTADSWITRLFTAEYAGQFDVYLDGLTRFGLPLPLGGSSNHFRTDVLRRIGAWDPYNVTEDADLGMRLARQGYRAAMIDSTTYEEAPAHFDPWLRQRTRWLKGWMQTWLVHMRQPRRLLQDLGLGGFVAFQLVVGGNVLAALVHPLFLVGLTLMATGHSPFAKLDDAAVAALTTLYGTTALAGYATSALIGWLGLRRRGLLKTSWALLLTPINWLMLSLAAWRALYQLVITPYRWEKTQHGLARTSRQADNLAASLDEVERYLRRLKWVDRSDAPALSDGVAAKVHQERGVPSFALTRRRGGFTSAGGILSSESA